MRTANVLSRCAFAHSGKVKRIPFFQGSRSYSSGVLWEQTLYDRIVNV